MVTLDFAALSAVYTALRAARRRPCPSPPSCAAFDPAGEDVRLVVLLPCHGPCARRSPHEDDGRGTATCVPCGTPRPTTDTTEEDQSHA
jgi:hypothetical protein